MSILRNVGYSLAEAKRRGLQRYYELVRGSKDAGQSEADEMAELLGKIGKTPDDLASDLSIVEEVREGYEAVRQLKTSGEHYQQAHAAHTAWVEEFRRIHEEGTEKVKRLFGEMNASADSVQRLRIKYGRAKNLAAQHPELFPAYAEAMQTPDAPTPAVEGENAPQSPPAPIPANDAAPQSPANDAATKAPPHVPSRAVTRATRGERQDRSPAA